MNRQLLEQAFAPALVKSRQGSFGRELFYVEARHYIERLNEAFDGAWSFEITFHELIDDEVIVLGRLSAGAVSKQAFGGSQVTKNRNSGELVSIADDFKSAATDALKKAASLMGVGLHLQGEDACVDPTPPVTRVRGAQATGNNPATPNPAGNGSSARLTARQLSAIWSIARERQTAQRDLRRCCMDTYGKQPEFLTKQEASALIDNLQAAARR